MRLKFADDVEFFEVKKDTTKEELAEFFTRVTGEKWGIGGARWKDEDEIDWEVYPVSKKDKIDWENGAMYYITCCSQKAYRLFEGDVIMARPEPDAFVILHKNDIGQFLIDASFRNLYVDNKVFGKNSFPVIWAESFLVEDKGDN